MKGIVYVVSLGPGGPGEITPRAEAALERSDVIVGYRAYVDLIADRWAHKEIIASAMKQEVDRCRRALELALSGRVVALVSSGDAGVYGMAGLMLEVADGSPEVEIEVVPGITAACSAAAVLGAPLSHDFAVVSLSDLLTPWPLIEKRLTLATEADFVLCLYNPASRGRRDYLRRACDVILAGRDAPTPSGWVRNIGRENQTHKILPLAELRDEELDMLCTVVVGNASTKTLAGRIVTPRGYRLEDICTAESNVDDLRPIIGARGARIPCGEMKILLFGGTTEGREIAMSGLPLVCSVATEYGADRVSTADQAEVLTGRLDTAAMERLIVERKFLGVIDATHPHAVEVTENVRLACERASVPRIRVLREAAKVDEEGVTTVASCVEAAKLLNAPPRAGANVLLTVGSRELEEFASLTNSRERLYARVLPTSLAIGVCEKLGFDAGHILAMQGPFTREMNRAMLEMTRARVLVTKDGGVAGGLKEKLAAARERGVDVLLIRRPDETGVTVAEALEWARRLLREASSGPFPPFPLFTDIAFRSAVVVGGGAVALRRVRTLLTCGALVTVVSPEFHEGFGEIASDEKHGKNLLLIERRCGERDIDGAFMVILATNDRALNRRLGEEARRRNIPVSVADAPGECAFFFPSLIDGGDAVAAVSTGGRSPGLNRRLSDRLRGVWRGWVEAEKREEEK
ncbi:MAG: precorrin-3B C(17)-methyltransferase, partial [Synergistaceae bacterium]|nr:precorrin-3B C(17)-methyltransferase [Synergistaceae bacterium]